MFNIRISPRNIINTQHVFCLIIRKTQNRGRANLVTLSLYGSVSWEKYYFEEQSFIFCPGQQKFAMLPGAKT